MRVRPFTIKVPQKSLTDLRRRLAATRWPDAVAGAGWDYGTDLAYLQELVAYWRDGFDWRAQELRLNRFAHFRAKVEGLDLHFIHERGKGERPLPIALFHGWPSSFLQMLPIIPLLADPAAHGADSADAFDVIVPSLPGYGFSDRPAEPGMNAARMAALLFPLITDGLGYERIALRGSDLGAAVTREMALAHPNRVLGLHHSGTSPYVMQPPADLSEAEQAMMAEIGQFQMAEGAYAMLQSTKPQTATAGLNDSPAGLAAWLVEKFRSWSDCEGEVERRFSKDELLTNLVLYWVTETIGSSMRLYYETAHVPSSTAGQRVETATAMAMLPKELIHGPREWHEREYNVVRWTELPRGGHFAEWEEPELIAEDIRAFFRPMREAAV